MNTHPFRQAGQMIDLCCVYLYVRRIWLYDTIIAGTRFRMNLHSTFKSFLNVKYLLSGDSDEIWCLSNCNGTWTVNHLVRKETLNHLATQLVKWLGCFVSTCSSTVFDWRFLSCQVHVWEWIHTLELLEYHWISCSSHGVFLNLSDCKRTWTHSH